MMEACGFVGQVVVIFFGRLCKNGRLDVGSCCNGPGLAGVVGIKTTF